MSEQPQWNSSVDRPLAQLVDMMDIGQTRGPEDLMEYTSPVCPGHYNHMSVHGNLRIGCWIPRRQWTGVMPNLTEEIILVWKGNSFEIVYEPNCMYCIDPEGHGVRDGVVPIQFVDKSLRR